MVRPAPGRELVLRVDDGVDLDFDELGRVDEAGDLDHRHRGTDVVEAFAEGDGDLFPLVDLGDVVSDADDIGDGGAGLAEGGFDGVQGLAGLGFGALGDAAIGAGGGGA